MSKSSLYNKLKGEEATHIHNHLGVCLLKPLPQRGGLKLPRVWWQSWVWPCLWSLVAVSAHSGLAVAGVSLAQSPARALSALSTLYLPHSATSHPRPYFTLRITSLFSIKPQLFGAYNDESNDKSTLCNYFNYIGHLNLSYQRQKVSW